MKLYLLSKTLTLFAYLSGKDLHGEAKMKLAIQFRAKMDEAVKLLGRDVNDPTYVDFVETNMGVIIASPTFYDAVKNSIKFIDANAKNMFPNAKN